MKYKKLIALLMSITLCGNVVLNTQTSINVDNSVVAETINNVDLSNIIWQGYFSGYYNEQPQRFKISMTMDISNNCFNLILKQMDNQEVSTFSFDYVINDDNITFIGKNDNLLNKTLKGIFDSSTYDIKITLNDDNIQGNIELNAMAKSSNIDAFINSYTQTDLNKYILDGQSVSTDLISPNVSFFQYDNEIYNYDLAVNCAKFSALAYQEYKYDDINDIFYNKSNNTITKPLELYNQLMRLGFKSIQSDFNLENYKSSYKDSDGNNASFTLAYKKVIQNDTIKYLTLVVIRGTDTVEWKGNMNIMGDTYNPDCKEHYSFKSAEECIKANLLDYLEKNGITNTDIVITGHSRGATVGNLLAKELSDMNDNSIINDVYAYTYATPNSTLYADENGLEISNGNKYDNIYNHCFTDDFVPQVPLKLWGYNKFGTTFTTNAEELSLNNQEFLDRANLSVSCSESLRSKSGFNSKRCEDMLSYIEKTWKTSEDYYNLIPKNSSNQDEKDTLYTFFTNTIASSAQGEASGLINVLTYPSNSVYKPILDFFVNNYRQSYWVNDTHQMYNYYNALKVNGFNSASTDYNQSYFSNNSTTDISQNDDFIEKVENTDDIYSNDLENIISIAKNNPDLNWDLNNVGKINGLYWIKDDNNKYHLGKIDLGYSNISGNLDLTSFDYLTSVKLNNTQITDLILPSNLTNLDDFSFYDCNYLKSITINSEDVSIGDNIFCYVPTDITIYAPNNSTLKEYCIENNINFVTMENPIDYKIGDINGDNNINVLDKILLKQYIMKRTSLNNSALKSADINSDGKVSIEDLKELSKLILID